MADDAQALSPLSSTSAATDADYDVIYTAFMETGRGRWFLQEYARRNRNADTQVLLSTLERIEETIRSERASISFDRIKFDLHEMARAIVRTKAEIAAIRPAGDGRLGEAGAELGAIVKAAEAATHRVLQAAEQVQELAWTMRERGIDPAACDKLNALATEIYLACEFQDLTGQRTGKIIQVLDFLEQRINTMVEIWGDDEAPPAERRPAPEMDQTDIDVVMAPPGTRMESAFPANPAVIDHEPVERGTGIPDELADALDRKPGMPTDGAAPLEPAVPVAAMAAAWTAAEPAAEPAVQAPVEPAVPDVAEVSAAATDAAPERDESPEPDFAEPAIDAPAAAVAPDAEAAAGDFAAGDLVKEDFVKEVSVKEDLVKEDLVKEDLVKTDLVEEDLVEEDLAAERLAADVLAAAAAEDYPEFASEPEPTGPAEIAVAEADAAPAREDAQRQEAGFDEAVVGEAVDEAVIDEAVVDEAVRDEPLVEAPVSDEAAAEDASAETVGAAPALMTADAAEGAVPTGSEAAQLSPFGSALEQALASVFEAPAPAEIPAEAAAEPAESERVAEVAETPAEPMAGDAAPAALAMDVDAAAIGAAEAVAGLGAAAPAPEEPAAEPAEAVAEPAEAAARQLVDIEALEAVDSVAIALDDSVVAVAPDETAAAAAPEDSAEAAAPEEPDLAAETRPDAALAAFGAAAEPVEAIDQQPVPEYGPTAAPAAAEGVAEIASEMRALLADWPAIAAPEVPTEASFDQPAMPAEPVVAEPESFAAVAPPEPDSPAVAEDIEPLAAAPDEQEVEAAAPAPIAEPVAAAEEPPASDPDVAAPFTRELWATEIEELPPVDAAAQTSQVSELDSELFEEPAATAPEPTGIAAAEQPAGQQAASGDSVTAFESAAARPQSIDNIASEIRALLAKWDIEPDAGEPEAPAPVAEMPAAADAEIAAAADAAEAGEPDAPDAATPVEAPVAAEPDAVAPTEVTAAPEPATPVEAVPEAARADDEGNGKDEELAALLFEPARPAVPDAAIVLATADVPNVEPAADASDDADETIWTPLDGVLPDWSERPAPPAKAVEAAFLSAAAVSMTAMAEITGTAVARPAHDPLAPVKAMSDEERIALFS